MSASISGSISRCRWIWSSRMRADKTVKLGDYFWRRPVILNLVYYTCPMLCGEELAGEASALGMLKLRRAKSTKWCSVSFNPDETRQMRAREEANLSSARIRASGARRMAGWHFLTGRSRCDQAAGGCGRISLRVRIRRTGQYIHAAAIMMVTPDGQDRPVLLRRGVFAQGSFAWA